MSKVLIIASGKSAEKYKEYDYKKHGWTVVAANNAYRIAENFDYWVNPCDFYGDKPVLTESQVSVTEAQFVPSLKKFGGIKECTGAGSIVLNSLYWALDCLNPEVIGLLGCDMDYKPDDQGHTHFYGVGNDILGKTRSPKKPDPLFQATRFKGRGRYTPEEFISYLYSRFLVTAMNHSNCRVVNLSFSKSTMLPYRMCLPEKL